LWRSLLLNTRKVGTLRGLREQLHTKTCRWQLLARA